MHLPKLPLEGDFNVEEHIRKYMRATDIKCGACAQLDILDSTASTREVWATLPDVFVVMLLRERVSTLLPLIQLVAATHTLGHVLCEALLQV